jgi:hypothetical protein
MKITIEQHKEKFTYESEFVDVDMSELTEKLYALCIGAGYHPDSVGECFFEKGREMTEHLYPDDNVEEDVVSSGVSDPIQGEQTISILSRYNEERKFTIIAKNCVEYSFKDDGHTGCSRNDDDRLESVDPSGGPFIGIGTNLGEYIHKDLGDLTVIKIKVDEHKAGTYYLTVK